MNLILKQARRLVILVIGVTVLLIGIAMLVLPGPAIVVIPAAIAILATEFLWARRLLGKFKNGASSLKQSSGLFKDPDDKSHAA